MRNILRYLAINRIHLKIISIKHKRKYQLRLFIAVDLLKFHYKPADREFF